MTFALLISFSKAETTFFENPHDFFIMGNLSSQSVSGYSSTNSENSPNNKNSIDSFQNSGEIKKDLLPETEAPENKTNPNQTDFSLNIKLPSKILNILIFVIIFISILIILKITSLIISLNSSSKKDAPKK